MYRGWRWVLWSRFNKVSKKSFSYPFTQHQQPCEAVTEGLVINLIRQPWVSKFSYEHIHMREVVLAAFKQRSHKSITNRDRLQAAEQHILERKGKLSFFFFFKCKKIKNKLLSQSSSVWVCDRKSALQSGRSILMLRALAVLITVKLLWMWSLPQDKKTFKGSILFMDACQGKKKTSLNGLITCKVGEMPFLSPHRDESPSKNGNTILQRTDLFKTRL